MLLCAEVAALVTVLMIDDTLQHTTVTSGVVVDAVTGDVRNTLQRKKSPI